MSTISLFASVDIKHDENRGEECLKKFLNPLKSVQ